VLKADIDEGKIPGAVVLVVRKGKTVYFESFGMRDKIAGTPMEKDSIFRIYSMTKPIVSVAAMMLHEEGRISLGDPVSKYIPEFKGLEVGMETTDSATGETTFSTVPAKREMNIHDLLRQTSGLTYGFFGKSAVKTMYKKAGIYKKNQTLAEFVQKLSKLPLAYQPGTKWEYSRSTDVLGHVNELASGMSLDQFLEERIFRPLGMNDTGFYVPPEKLDRLVQQDPKDGKRRPLLDVTKPPKFLSGGGGLVTTAGDYARFLQMLLDGGKLDKTRLLGRHTVQYMTADHLSSYIDKSGPRYYPGDGYGFGLGFAVRVEPGVSRLPGSTGDYFWLGYAGTNFFVNPQEELIGVFMIQEPTQMTHYIRLFRNLVMQAIVD
jgi:CubicO group peptidase (beta-lactamase class C family)